MAIQCKYCGVDLPKDDARFCNKCGMLVPSHPFSPQSLSASKSGSKVAEPSSSNEQRERQKRVLHEQIAELSPSRSKLDHVELNEPVKKLDEREQQPVEIDTAQSDQSFQASASREELPLEKLPETPQPELKEDVWERLYGQNEVSSPSASPDEEAAPVRELWTNEGEDEEVHKQADLVGMSVEDAPTQAVDIPVEDVPTQVVGMPVEDVPTRAIPVPDKKPSGVQEQVVERLPSSPFLSVPSTQIAAQERLAEDLSIRAKAASSEPVASYRSNEALFISAQGYQAAGVAGGVTQNERNVAAASSARRIRRRWPIVVVVLLLVVLVIGGLGAAMLISQHSGNDPVTQPQVSFSDTQLGISLLYPNGWIKQVDSGTSTVHFYASNHIGAVDIIGATSSGDVKQALQQQATKMGMSGTKAGATLTFAGASWQQMQGTMNQGGANFSDVLLATSHGSKTFVIVQQAPQSNYVDWEKEFFAPLRNSFKFL